MPNFHIPFLLAHISSNYILGCFGLDPHTMVRILYYYCKDFFHWHDSMEQIRLGPCFPQSTLRIYVSNNPSDSLVGFAAFIIAAKLVRFPYFSALICVSNPFQNLRMGLVVSADVPHSIANRNCCVGVDLFAF